MSNFQEIKTQEEFDEAIKERLERERAKFADYGELKDKNAKLTSQIETLNKQISDTASKYKDTDKTIADLNSRIKAYESDSVKTRIALQKGLPYEFASRLKGETEEELIKDAETFASFMSKGNPEPISTNGEDPGSSSNQAWAELLTQIK